MSLIWAAHSARSSHPFARFVGKGIDIFFGGVFALATLPATLSAQGAPRISVVSIIVVRTNGDTVTGNGVVVGLPERVVTERSILVDAAEFQVRGRAPVAFTLKATLVAEDTSTGIAILQAPGLPYPPARIGRRQTTVNDSVVVATLGPDIESIPVLIPAKVSRVQAFAGGVSLARLSQSVAPDNNGAPVLNAAGDLVGIAFASITNDVNSTYEIPARYVERLAATVTASRPATVAARVTVLRSTTAAPPAAPVTDPRPTTVAAAVVPLPAAQASPRNDARIVLAPFFPLPAYKVIYRDSIEGSRIGLERGRYFNRAAIARVAMERLEAQMHADGVPDAELTRRLFEGRFLPDVGDLALAMFDAHGCEGWNARFGAIGDVGEVTTYVNGRSVQRTGRDLLIRTGIRFFEFQEYPLPRDPDLTYAQAVRLKGNASQLDSILSRVNTRFCAPEIFNVGNSNDADPFYLRNDYEAMRRLGTVVVATSGPNAGARIAGGVAATTREVPHDFWTYAHGSGFTVSPWLLDREERAREINRSSNGFSLLLSLATTLTGTDQTPDGVLNETRALIVVNLQLRRAAAEQVLGTVAGWTMARFNKYRFAGTADDQTLQQIIDGAFQATWGVVPSENITIDVARAYPTRLLEAYHDAYAETCRSDRSLPWRTLTYRGEEVVTTYGYGLVKDRQTIVEAATREVREPYTFSLREVHPNKDDSFAILLSGVARPKYSMLRKDFSRFLATTGCATAVTRQFEVNLYLFQQGFPSAQSLIGGSR